MSIKQNIKSFISNLSHRPGVYQMLGENNEVLYVGKAKNLQKRIASYFSSRVQDLKTASLVKQIHNIDVTLTNTENEAVLLECNLIKKYKPRYNVLLRDDKSYPYILITTAHPFPRIDTYRGVRKKNVALFGPYPSATAVRETINLLQKIFRLRTCVDSFFATRSRPCLLYQIGRCTGPCVGLISSSEYQEHVQLAMLFLQGKSNHVIDLLQTQMENAAQQLDYEGAARYRDQINRLRQIQDRQYVNVDGGNADVIGFALQAGVVCIQLLTIREGVLLGSRAYFPTVPPHSEIEEVMTAFLTQHYLLHPSHIESIPSQIILSMNLPEQEWLQNVLSEQRQQKVILMQPVRGEKRRWLLMANTSAQQSLHAQLLNKTNLQERLMDLQKVLALANMPQRIECFDISHSMGEATVGACVVFDQTGPVKNAYRRYNIVGITSGDDVAAIQQVITRRYKKYTAENLPSLILIDGGKTQLTVAANALIALGLSNAFLVGVSKGPDRKPGFETLHFLKQPPLHLPAHAHALHLIQQIRDEAHRFAITGHRLRRDKVRTQSLLERIPGIGAKRRREILRYFGGIQGVAHASLDELMKVPGINRPLAEKIFAAFHDDTL